MEYAQTNQEMFLADWASTIRSSGLRDLIALIMRPEVLSLASGLPASELFPMSALAAAAAQVFEGEPGMLQYRPSSARLREQIAQLMASQGVEADPEQIVITTGAQQALDMLTRLFLNPGGQVMLEAASYTGVKQVVAPLMPEILPVPTDVHTGMDVDWVARRLEEGARPAYIYAMARGHNPTGVTMSVDKRQQLVALARQYNFPIIEDDAYGFLGYDKQVGVADTPLRALDQEHVFYLGSFSKILVPSLRLGWIVTPKWLLPKLAVIKETCDLETSAFTQSLVANYLDANDMMGHIAHLQDVYRERRDAMLNALKTHFPQSARWSVPTHGLFIWVELPQTIDTTRLLEVALAEEQVAFVPSGVFAVYDDDRGNPGINHCMRLNFSQVTPERIEEGVRRIAKLL
ncbi:MAG: PLP-dependent aminotransferase family protein [Chloroflexota bacterium]